jgi:hypothetical protein
VDRAAAADSKPRAMAAIAHRAARGAVSSAAIPCRTENP